MSCELGFALVSEVLAEYSVKAQFVILGDFGVCGRVEPFVGGVSMVLCNRGVLIRLWLLKRSRNWIDVALYSVQTLRTSS